MRLDQVIGQKNIVNWFASCIARDKLPQVTLLEGPAGIGKTSIAKIVACEIACMNAPERLEDTKQAVIQESKSTDCVHLYNMSNMRSQEAVSEVKSDLSIGFSATGRKVIIMDEAHGMSEEAQDSLLTQFESLQAQVYVLICTTEIESFRDAFLSRCILRKLTNLSAADMRTFLRRRIEENKLHFELRLPMVYELISAYTGREPRRAINLLDSFETGSTVTVSELETFVSVFEGKSLVTLVDYLYAGNMLAGLEFISEMDMGLTVQSTLLEILRVAENGKSELLDRDASLHLRKVTLDGGIKNLLGFVIDCTTCSRLTRSMLSGFFLKWCTASDNIMQAPPTYTAPDSAKMQDLGEMNRMLEEQNILPSGTPTEYLTLDMLMAGGETVELASPAPPSSTRTYTIK